MKKVADYTLKIAGQEFVPIMIGGMGVNISTPEMAAEASRLGGIGHISDAMVGDVCDHKYGTSFSVNKARRFPIDQRSFFDKTNIKFNPEEVREAQLLHVRKAMDKKQGSGAIFINIMEKLTMASAKETLNARINAAIDGGIDGITFSAGLHQYSMGMVVTNPKAKHVKIGIVVSSYRALAIFLRSAGRAGRLPDYIVLEGPLAGGHLGFGDDWADYNLCTLLQELLAYMKEKDINIPVLAAGGVFGGQDAVKLMELGASGVQVATRFAITKESGLPDVAKQAYLHAKKEDVVVSHVSPTGYPIRLLKNSPCLASNVKPNCELFGYVLNDNGTCQYLDAYQNALNGVPSQKDLGVINDKFCLCYHFSKCNCYTCGANVYKLKELLPPATNGIFDLPTTEEVFLDYRDNEGLSTL